MESRRIKEDGDSEESELQVFLASMPRDFRTALRKGYSAVVHFTDYGKICIDFDNGLGRLEVWEHNVVYSPEDP